MALTKEDVRILGDLLDRKLEEKFAGFREEQHVMKADMADMKEDIAGIKEEQRVMKADIADMKEDIAGIKEEQRVMKADIADMKEDIAGIKEEQRVMKADMAGMKEDIAGVKEEIADIREDIAGVKEEIVDIREDVTGIKVTLENEIEKNISIIAEGHGTLVRQLDEIRRDFDKTEMLPARMNVVEGEVRRIGKLVRKQTQLKEG